LTLCLGLSDAEHAEEEVLEAWTEKKGSKDKPSRRNVWLVFLREVEKGRRLKELLLSRNPDLRKQYGSKGE